MGMTDMIDKQLAFSEAATLHLFNTFAVVLCMHEACNAQQLKEKGQSLTETVHAGGCTPHCCMM